MTLKTFTGEPWKIGVTDLNLSYAYRKRLVVFWDEDRQTGKLE